MTVYEPSLGLAPLVTRQVVDSLAEINRAGRAGELLATDRVRLAYPGG